MGLPTISRQHPPVDKEVASLTAACEGLTRGDVFTYEQIEATTGFVKGEPLWDKAVRKWRRAILQARGIALAAVPNVGYMLMDNDQQLEAAARLAIARVAKCQRKSTQLLVGIDDKDLNDAQRDRRDAIAEHVSNTHDAQAVSLAKLKSRIVVPRALPRPPIPEE